MEFQILKKSKNSRARLGWLKTSHGEVETPALVPVATQAALKSLTSRQAGETGSQIFICNTFHLHLKPGEKIVKAAGGLHRFMNWPKPLMTDSGGFQVFSLGFGRDQDVGKILKYFPGAEPQPMIEKSVQPKTVKITDAGVFFRSPLDGSRLFLGPKESMKIQSQLGADVVFAFDECTSPLSSIAYVKESLSRTHAWAKVCLALKSSKQALFGIVQGSHYKELRKEGACFVGSLPFDGYGIGGDLGRSKRDMINILNWTIPELVEEKPRHLLGIGYLSDIPLIVRQGIDLFDCTVPTHYARRGVAFTSKGRLDLNFARNLSDKKPLDLKCACETCQNYTRMYLCHLLRAREMTAFSLLTIHNLYFFNQFVKSIRQKIKKGEI
ncbi:MAG: tRNA guanosine(34) transglycosylase Tgt [Patescibacteria group bacterium]